MMKKFSEQIRNFLDVSGLKPGSAAPLSGAMDAVINAFKPVFNAPLLKPVRALTANVRAPQTRFTAPKGPSGFAPRKPRNIWE